MTSAEALSPVIFLSHGAGPAWFIEDDGGSRSSFLSEMGPKSLSAEFLRNLRTNASLPRHPKAILVVSAHWEENEHTVMMSDKTSLYYDYYGFPEATYEIKWPVRGSSEVAKSVCKLLAERGITYREDHKRGLDHGVFIPLKLAYPEADIPVLQVSLKKNLNILDHLKLGEALEPLRQQGVMIIGSGMTTHNTSHIKNGSSVDDWCEKFTTWFHDVMTNPSYTPDERKRRLLDSANQPTFAIAHPRIEHYLPALVVAAAGGYEPGTIIFNQTVLGSMVVSHVKF